jgi:HEAT repeat protein
MLDAAIDALKTYDWGVDPSVLQPIEQAIVATHGDAAARADLESRLVAILQSEVSRDAKDYVCRKLMVIGSAACVPALASLLPSDELSHMARYALERIPADEAAEALRQAMSQVAGALKIGVISSLGVRGDEQSIAALGELIADADAQVGRAAAFALGAIRSDAAARALATAKPADRARSAVTDASLACAERLLHDGKKTEALAIYKGLAGAEQPSHVRLAATRGMLACAGKG